MGMHSCYLPTLSPEYRRTVNDKSFDAEKHQQIAELNVGTNRTFELETVEEEVPGTAKPEFNNQSATYQAIHIRLEWIKRTCILRM